MTTHAIGRGRSWNGTHGGPVHFRIDYKDISEEVETEAIRSVTLKPFHFSQSRSMSSQGDVDVFHNHNLMTQSTGDNLRG
jgi:hypothetical protein